MVTVELDIMATFWLSARALEWVPRFLLCSVMADKKHKDVSPKKETVGKKKDRREVIAVSDDEGQVSMIIEIVAVSFSRTTKISLKKQLLQWKSKKMIMKIIENLWKIWKILMHL